MIQLSIEDYCQDCPDFNARVDRDTLYDNRNIKTGYCTSITCQYAHRCRNIARMIKKQMEKEIEQKSRIQD